MNIFIAGTLWLLFFEVAFANMTAEGLELYKLLGFTDDEIIKTNNEYYESIKLYKFITGGKYE